MLYDFNPTVRMYPRTINEAFQDTVENAQWMEHYKAPATIKDVALYVIVVLVAAALAMVIAWKP